VDGHRSLEDHCALFHNNHDGAFTDVSAKGRNPQKPELAGRRAVGGKQRLP